MTKPTYYCDGSVRGHCGHKHRTVETAIACLERDSQGCKSQGGYSDRSVYRSDGVWIGTEFDHDGKCVISQETEQAAEHLSRI